MTAPAGAWPAPWPPGPLTIQVVIDSVALLSGLPPEQCVFLFDDGVVRSGNGTLSLVSTVVPGQLVHWAAVPLDLQAPGWICGISFEPAHKGPVHQGTGPAAAPPGPAAAPAWALAWAGIVPGYVAPGDLYPYQLLLTFADGGAEPIRLDGPALRVAGAPPGSANQVVPDAQPVLPPLRDSGDVL